VSLGIACLLSAATGFVALSWEILWIRVYSFATAGRAHAFGHLLGAYLFGIAVGSFAARRWCSGEREGRRTIRALATCLIVGNVVAAWAVPGAAEVARRLPPPCLLPLFALAAALLGTALPLLAHASIPADGLAGARLARLYLANIAGCAAGSLVTGFVLLDAAELHLVGAGLALAGGCVAWGVAARARSFALGIAAPIALFVSAHGMSANFPLWEKLQLKTDYRPGVRFAYVIENRSGVITVDAAGAVYGGGAYDGRFNVDAAGDENGITRAYAVAALHPAPRDVLVVGLGSGAWTQVLAHHPSVERVVVVEINPGYLELLGHRHEVFTLRTNPKVRFVIDDGRRWLHAHADRFDLIVQNTTYYWRANCTNLVSREYFELARAHLRDGGVFYSNTTGSLDILKTACAAFPHVRRFRNFVAVSDRPMAVDPARARATLEAWRVDGFVHVPAFRIEEILGGAGGDWEDRDSIVDRSRSATVITDDNMASEW